MSGYVAMQRDWQAHEFFGGEEFSRRDAWAWLIAHAAWKATKARLKGATVELQRGELCFSVRFLAEKWGWSKSRVDRFVVALRAEGMIETRSKIGTEAGHSAGHGQSIITICNYDKFQNALKGERDSDRAESGTTAGQQRDKEEPSNQDNHKPEEQVVGDKSPSYAFFGQTIRLTPRHFDEWKRLFRTILDLEAELSTIDGWWQTQPEEKRKAWFHATKSMLNKRHQSNLATKKGAEDDAYSFHMP